MLATTNVGSKISFVMHFLSSQPEGKHGENDRIIEACLSRIASRRRNRWLFVPQATPARQFRYKAQGNGAQAQRIRQGKLICGCGFGRVRSSHVLSIQGGAMCGGRDHRVWLRHSGEIKYDELAVDGLYKVGDSSCEYGSQNHSSITVCGA